MALLATIRDSQEEPVILNSFREHNDGYFWIYNKDDESKGVRINYPYGSKPAYDPHDTELIFLLNPFQGESAVMEAVTSPGTKKLGYIFSILSMGSENHQYSNDPHFRKSCYAATYKTIERFVSTEEIEITIPEIYTITTLEELFGSDLSILSIHKPYTKKSGILPTALIADLFRYGYTVLDVLGSPPPLRLDIAKSNFGLAKAANKLLLRSYPEYLVSDGLIGNFIGQRLTCPDSPVLRFFYLYQIVERLLEIELRNQFKKLSSEFVSGSLDTLKIMDAFHEFKEALSEKNRIRTLFGVRSGNAFTASPTANEFIAFLQECKIPLDPGLGFGELLYKVRNSVFHGWWRISDKSSNSFINLVAGLENDIPELLINYSRPSEDSISLHCEWMI